MVTTYVHQMACRDLDSFDQVGANVRDGRRWTLAFIKLMKSKLQVCGDGRASEGHCYKEAPTQIQCEYFWIYSSRRYHEHRYMQA